MPLLEGDRNPYSIKSFQIVLCIFINTRVVQDSKLQRNIFETVVYFSRLTFYNHSVPCRIEKWTKYAMFRVSKAGSSNFVKLVFTFAYLGIMMTYSTPPTKRNCTKWTYFYYIKPNQYRIPTPIQQNQKISQIENHFHVYKLTSSKQTRFSVYNLLCFNQEYKMLVG